jgi:hypothetical protein
MIRLRQSTASQEVPLGQFVDSTDGVSAETGLSIANTDIKLWKMGATSLANKNSGGATHMSVGIYYCVLDATDTNTLGGLALFIQVSGALPVRVECEVLSAAVYDALIASSASLSVAIASGGIANASFAANAISASKVNTDVDARLADAIWDEARAGHVSAGSFGQGVASVQGNITGSVASVASGGITSASFASGAVNAAALASDAVAEIADGVWDESQSGHTSAGTFGKYLDGQVTTGGASAASVAAAVWDEARAGHVGAGSFGQGVASVQGNVTGSIASVASGGITAASLAADSITAAKVAADVSAEIADAVWDEAQSGHTGVGSFGRYLDQAVSGVSTGGVSAADIADAVWDEAQAGHTTAGTFGKYVDAAISGVSTGGVSASDIADAVWDEARAGHVSAGTFGQGVASVQGAVTSIASGGIVAATFAAGAVDAAALNADAVAEIADGVWDEVQAGHTTTGTFGKNLDAQVSTVSSGGVTAAAIADAVWDEARSGHVVSGTFGEGVAAVKGSVDSVGTGGIAAASFASGAVNAAALASDAVAEIADGVWDEAQSGHTTAGTFGKYLDAPVGTGGVDPDDVAAAVWDASRAAHVAAGSFGEGAASVQGNVTGSVASVAAGGITAASLAADAITAAKVASDVGAEIADAVWDEVQSGHVTVGTFGKYLDAAISGVSTGGVSVSDIADAVWDELRAGHVVSGSFGEGVVANSLAADSLSATALSAAAVDKILDDPVDGGITLRQLLRGFASALLARASGLGTPTAIFRDTNNTKNRIVASVDSAGNRTAVTLDLT